MINSVAELVTKKIEEIPPPERSYDERGHDGSCAARNVHGSRENAPPRAKLRGRKPL